ncbi:MAG TPA: tetratricopeptide repeat protein [Thermodesulfobacteriota bacterium]|nr:tetratricopeptide repeat protein [Thermodesulfobacteriota bacterium]
MRDRNNIALLGLVITVVVLFTACQQVKEIPDEIPGQLPNPVKDFTEKDNYIIGLNWYKQWNYGIAAKYWKPLAAEGDCDACYALGLLYFEGLGVGQSYEKALKLWTRSGAQGQGQAQISLGVVYARLDLPYTSLDCRNGCGAGIDLTEAYKWFGIAREVGSPREKQIAEDSLKKIVPQMTPEEIREGDSRVEAWKPDPARCDTRGYFIVAP